MGATKVTQKKIRSLWKKRMKAFEASGMTQQAWCEKKGIPLSTFTWWKHTIKKEMELQERKATAVDEIEIPAMYEIEVEKQQDTAELAVEDVDSMTGIWNSLDVARKQWQERVEAFDKSGMTVMDWCRKNKVDTSALYLWYKKIKGISIRKANGNPGHEELRDLWKKRIDDFNSSHLSVAEWCRKNEINDNTFYYWFKNIQGVGKNEQNKSPLVKLSSSVKESCEEAVDANTMELSAVLPSEENSLTAFETVENPTDSYTLWKKRVEDFSKSGKSVAVWCQENNISRPSLYHWYYEIKGVGIKEANKPKRDAEHSLWKERIIEWQNSGVSMRKWCIEHNIVYTQFQNWYRAFKKGVLGGSEDAEIEVQADEVLDGRENDTSEDSNNILKKEDNPSSIWEERINAYEQSGMPISVWCKKNSVNCASFYRWYEKLRGLNVKEMNELKNKETCEIWEKRVSDFNSSNSESASDWCAEHKIPYRKFRYWANRFKREARQNQLKKQESEVLINKEENCDNAPVDVDLSYAENEVYKPEVLEEVVDEFALWKKRVEDFDKSNKTIEDWSNELGVSIQVLYQWYGVIKGASLYEQEKQKKNDEHEKLLKDESLHTADILSDIDSGSSSIVDDVQQNSLEQDSASVIISKGDISVKISESASIEFIQKILTAISSI